MNRMICIAMVLALAGLTGCAKQEKAPDPAPEETVGQQPTAHPISTEDFESGEVDEVDEGGEEAGDEDQGNPPG